MSSARSSAADPLVIAVPNNDAVGVVPGGGGFSVTQVTAARPSFVKPGDLVWCLPTDASPRTLALARIVVYKSMPLSQFGPCRRLAIGPGITRPPRHYRRRSRAG